jgi:hypothetical protein
MEPVSPPGDLAWLPHYYYRKNMRNSAKMGLPPLTRYSYLGFMQIPQNYENKHKTGIMIP